MQEVMGKVRGNPASLHTWGVEAERWVEEARRMLAEVLMCEPKELIFTSGGTEANNLAIQGIVNRYPSRGRHVITTSIEHASVYEVMKHLEKMGWEITYLPVNADGMIAVSDVEKAIRADTVLISVIHVNNETGAIQPIEAIGQLLKAHPKVYFHVDAVQSFAKIPLHPKEMGIDLLSLSAHKVHGPKGVGALFKAKSIMLTPLFFGGGQEGDFRSGTVNVPGVVGFAKAAQITHQQRGRFIERSRSGKAMLLEELAEIPGVHWITPTSADKAVPYVVNVAFPGLKSEVLIHALEKEGLLVSSQSACSSKLGKVSRVLTAMGIRQAVAEGAIRFSMGVLTTEHEIEEAIAIIKRVILQYKEWMKV